MVWGGVSIDGYRMPESLFFGNEDAAPEEASK